MPLNWKSKKVVVVGLGVSGIAACKLLCARGAHVVGTDKKPRSAVSKEVIALETLGVTLALGGHEDAGMMHADRVIVSPGVPSSELAAVEARGVPIWGEVELAVRELNAAAEAAGRPLPRILAIGGTNGKSTTTSLVGDLLAAGGLRTFVGGNLGEPLALHTSEAFDAVVLEVSSFQMERAETFHPHVSVLLNITPDHLDRYPSFDAYANAKGNAFLRQEPSDMAVVPFADSMCEAQAKRGRAKIVSFGPGGDFDVTNAVVVDRASGATYERAKMHLQGGHNALNVAASLAAVRPFSVSPETIRTVLANFKGLAHRMALVAEHAGVRYYDDSKGTNVGASVTAVRGVVEPKVVAILGGRDKGGSYEPLVRALAEKGRAAVLIGEAADAIARAMGNVVPVHRAGSMGEAVACSASLAQPGDAVLLSPACSSFDMFADYKHRGDAFVAAVKDLERGSP